MQRAVPDPVADVESDPAAVFDAHGADTVDELVASGSEPAPEPGAEADDAEIAALFADGLEPSDGAAGTHRGTATDDAASESDTDERSARADSGDAVLTELERAAGSADAAADADDGSVTEAADADVADALAAAEAVYEGDLPDEIPFE